MVISLKTVQQMTDKEKTMITVYEAEIEVLQTENSQLKAQVAFLKEQLAYKTFGKPCYNEEVNDK
mgnify:CR=1 FL=1